jgi:hypothetical protein
MKKNRSPIFWVLILLFVAVAAIIIGYNLGIKKVSDEVTDMRVKEKNPMSPSDKESPQVKQEIPEEKEIITLEDIEEGTLSEDTCELLEEQVREFFIYLNKQEYIKTLEQERDTYDHFKTIIYSMMMRLPVPAGEGLAQEVMSLNIFHFFRILKKSDLKLISEVIKNEEDTLELNLAIFFKWLAAGNKCPDPDKIKPSLRQMYHYAGFFLNTIGGRAYLFRRTQEQRLLISYYCMLIMHEAEKNGLNSYGIDISPWTLPLIMEIESCPDLKFREEYIGRLKVLQDYYSVRRTEN